MKKKLQFNGARPKGVSPAKTQAIFNKIERKHGDLTPQVLLQEARHSSHPLHNYFEWDNEVAGELHRLAQARMLIASLVVVDTQGNKIRAFLNVMKDDCGDYTNSGFHSNESCYMNTDDIFNDEKLRNYSLQRAKRELEAFKIKYRNLKELESLIKGIDDFLGKSS